MRGARGSKAKGSAYQREIRDLLVKILGLDPDDIESRPMGSNGCDLIMGVQSRAVFPFAVECKRCERLNINAAWDQATGNAGKLQPIVFHRRSRKPSLVTVDAILFLELWSKRNVK